MRLLSATGQTTKLAEPHLHEKKWDSFTRWLKSGQKDARSPTRPLLSPAQLAQAGVAKCQCPLCGAIWTARIRGEIVSFPPHQPPQRARSSTMSRWAYQCETDEKIRRTI